MHQAKAHAPFLGLQTIIVTDGESASASEIVAGAMRTLSGAQLVGSPTYGKWSVQRMYVFEDQSAIKLTVARYHIADKDAGTDLRGLQPDVLVRRETVHQKTLERLRHLTRSVDGAEALVNELAKIDSNEVAHPHLGPLSERLTLDPQLAAAWTLALDNQ
jgi:C-terminal processing protease CtpA/Prc